MTAHQAFRLPHDPLLIRLLIAAQQYPTSEPVIHDVAGFQKTYSELLGDILMTCDALRERLPTAAFNERGLLQKEHGYVALLTRTGYEFVVGFFAICALGGVCMIFPSGILPEEAECFISKSRAICLLVGDDRVERARKTCDVVNRGGQTTSFPWILISTGAKGHHAAAFAVDDTLRMAAEDPGVVLFTSGTTGRPKGVVLPRQCFGYEPLAEAGNSCINHRAAHWSGGAHRILNTVLSGMKLYHLGEKAGAQEILDAFAKHTITNATFSPMLLRNMRELLNASGELEVYAKYFQRLFTIRCTAGVLEASTMEFWTALTGLPFENVYGATEFGGVATTALSKTEGTIGTPVSGVKVKLSKGNHGEILIKSPRMLIRYLDDVDSTLAAFDEGGYYKTGDLGELRSGECHFRGRASADFISFRYFRIPAVKVENGISDLAYISEACVLGVPHKEARELCGAVVRLRKDDSSADHVALTKIRSDLANSMPPFMLPTVLRVMRDGEELSRTVSGKLIKRDILRDFFDVAEWFMPEKAPADVEYWGCTVPPIKEEDVKPWYWCGLQCAD